MEWIKSNLPVISICLITLGIVRLNAYYSYFGINITSYLDLAEIVQLQFNYFAAFVCIMIISNISTTLHINSLLGERSDNIYDELLKPKKFQQDRAFRVIANYLKYRTKTYAILACIAYSGAFIYKAYAKHIISYPSIEATVIVLALYMLVNTSSKYDRLLKSFGYDEKKSANALAIAAALILAFVSTYEFSRDDAFDLIVRRSENEVTMSFESSKVSTNDSTVFVGKTKNYIFTYNRFTRQSQVYPFSDIKSIQYRPGKEYNAIPSQYRIGK